jgi:hypothetical protein
MEQMRRRPPVLAMVVVARGLGLDLVLSAIVIALLVLIVECARSILGPGNRGSQHGEASKNEEKSQSVHREYPLKLDLPTGIDDYQLQPAESAHFLSATCSSPKARFLPSTGRVLVITISVWVKRGTSAVGGTYVFLGSAMAAVGQVWRMSRGSMGWLV